MTAQDLTLGESHTHTLVWRGLLLLRAIGIGTAAGFIAGFIAGGIGSRLAMKVVALTAGPSAQGRLTENGSTIGVFTAETIFLLLTGAALGMVGGLLYMALRPWLPVAERWRGLACGAVLLATGGALIIEGANFDFIHFGFPILNATLFVALYLAFGLLIAPLADWLDRRLPVFSADQVGQLGLSGTCGLVAVAALPVTLVLGAVLGAANGLAILGGFLITVCGLVAAGLHFVPVGTTRRGRQLGCFAFAVTGGVFGCFVLTVFAALLLGPAGGERGAVRLVGMLVLLLIAGGLGGRQWLTRTHGHAGKRRTSLALAVPVLTGLSMTLKELGIILFGG